MVYDQLMTNFCTSAILILYTICASLRAFDSLLTICFARFLMSPCGVLVSCVTVGMSYWVRLGSIHVVRVLIKRLVLSATLASPTVKSLQLLKRWKLEVSHFMYLPVIFPPADSVERNQRTHYVSKIFKHNYAID